MVQVANAEIARVLRDLSDLLEIQGANAFRVRAYRNAARTAESWPEPLAQVASRGRKELMRLPGVGPDLAAKLEELVLTGSLAQYQSEARRLPTGVLELLQVPGLGPKRVRLLHEFLKIENIRDLEDAARAGRVRKVPGFSQRTEARLLEDLGTVEHGAKRFLRAAVTTYAEALLAFLRAQPGVIEADIAGSYRRHSETVGDLDMVVCCEEGCPVIERFISYDGVARVVEKGETRAVVKLRSGLQAELKVLPRESFGAGLHYFTGSKAHLAAVQSLAHGQGMVIDQYGVYRGDRRVAGATEAEVVEALGLPWILPELREGRGEIEAALAGRLPKLLEPGDIRGDLQMHTTASDGAATLEAMAEAAQELGLEYIAFTDHTPALKMIQGLDREGFRRQWEQIDRVNAKLRTLTVLKGAEVDIFADGSLDLDDETLAELDVVVVSLHSKLALPPDEQTRRMVLAISHPNVDIVGHPRGRKLLQRTGALFDMVEVAKAAADHGVMLEVNAQPDRLDLQDADVKIALEHGVKLVVSTDAHSTRDLRFTRWGVDQARRGWATRNDVANTRPLAEFRKLLHGGR